jgi:uncharacterized protein YbaA (DUF1428 family)
MTYVDGYLVAVPKKHLKAYQRMAKVGLKAWMKHGAVDYKECWGDDLASKWGTPFTRVMKLRPGETVVFAYIVFKSRAHRDRVNAKVMKEMMAMGGPQPPSRDPSHLLRLEVPCTMVLSRGSQAQRASSPDTSEGPEPSTRAGQLHWHKPLPALTQEPVDHPLAPPS